MKRVLFLRRQMDGFGGIQRVSVDVAGLFKKKRIRCLFSRLL